MSSARKVIGRLGICPCVTWKSIATETVRKMDNDIWYEGEYALLVKTDARTRRMDYSAPHRTLR